MAQVSPFHLRLYLAAYQAGHSPHGARSIYASIRAFFGFLVREGVLPDSPLKAIRPPRPATPARVGYSQGEVRAVLAVLQADRTPLGLRNLAAFSLLLDCGLRAGQLCHLTLQDMAGEGVLVRESKSGSPGSSTWAGGPSRPSIATFPWAGPGSGQRGTPLLVADDGGPMTTGALRQALRRLGEKVGVHLSAHRLRHTWATQMPRAGAGLETLRLLGGWSGYEMVRRYAHLGGEDLRERATRLSPLDRP